MQTDWTSHHAATTLIHGNYHWINRSVTSLGFGYQIMPFYESIICVSLIIIFYLNMFIKRFLNLLVQLYRSGNQSRPILRALPPQHGLSSVAPGFKPKTEQVQSRSRLPQSDMQASGFEVVNPLR
ncbi:hypothetical protein TNCV_129321 [Trichonephila clavipes]|nr:hypothetical protein TNCV_129321 [Trichonephila clavipes]